ncbi:MAG: hypothetical protein ACJ0RN_03665 [Candidatus Neomarinimicrobiota bacterium]|jgi:hypothetical protein
MNDVIDALVVFVGLVLFYWIMNTIAPSHANRPGQILFSGKAPVIYVFILLINIGAFLLFFWFLFEIFFNQ